MLYYKIQKLLYELKELKNLYHNKIKLQVYFNNANYRNVIGVYRKWQNLLKNQLIILQNRALIGVADTAGK